MYRFISSRTWVFFLHIHRVHGYMLLYFTFLEHYSIELPCGNKIAKNFILLNF